MKKRTITAELAMAEIAIANALQQPNTLKKLAAFNYDRKQLLEGKSLKEEVQMLELAKQDKYGRQYSHTDNIKARRKEIIQLYRQHVKRAQLAFENQRGTLEQLQLLGSRKMDVDGLMGQVYAFYSKIMLYAEDMSKYNVSPEELEQTKAMVEAYFAARQQQVQSIGEAQHATHQREAKRRELRKWMAQFRKIARIALADEPQMLETLGILVPSQKA